MLNIELKKVKLKNGRDILGNISSVINPNGIFSIVGKNGTGKTTFIKSLTNLLDDKHYSVDGRVVYNGRDILSMDNKELSRLRKYQIKYVFQDAINSFDPLRTFKFYFNKLAKDDGSIDKLLDYFLLPRKKELFRLYPYEVSGGMAQRINFVLALAAEPEIIILDEPTSGIDSAVANLFIEKMRDFVQYGNNAIILVTHDLSFAGKVSTSIAFLANGSLTDFQKPEIFFLGNRDPELDSVLNSYGKLIS